MHICTLFLCARLNIGSRRYSSCFGTTQWPSYRLDPSCLTWAARNLVRLRHYSARKESKRPGKKLENLHPFLFLFKWGVYFFDVQSRSIERVPFSKTILLTFRVLFHQKSSYRMRFETRSSSCRRK